MISQNFPDSDRVLNDLGTPLIHAFIDAVDGARGDYIAFKQWQPSWFPNFTNRFTANFLHERIWDRLTRAIDGNKTIHINDREPTREIRSGTSYLIRIKRHHPGERISAYPTETSSAFWLNSTPTLDGLEFYTLALGYYWDTDLRAVGDATLSFRDGKDNPIWAIQLQRNTGNATGFSRVPVTPNLPEIDLSGITRDVEKETGS